MRSATLALVLGLLLLGLGPGTAQASPPQGAEEGPARSSVSRQPDAHFVIGLGLLAPTVLDVVAAARIGPQLEVGGLDGPLQTAIRASFASNIVCASIYGLGAFSWMASAVTDDGSDALWALTVGGALVSGLVATGLGLGTGFNLIARSKDAEGLSQELRSAIDFSAAMNLVSGFMGPGGIGLFALGTLIVGTIGKFTRQLGGEASLRVAPAPGGLVVLGRF